mgnify:CR=1 FL=1
MKMATLTHSGIAPANYSFFAKFKSANMSDRQLADIGIARQDIVKIVFRDKLHL